MLTLNLTTEQLILLRTFIYNTRLGYDGPFNEAAFELAKFFEEHEITIDALIDKFGCPKIKAKKDEYGVTFKIAE